MMGIVRAIGRLLKAIGYVIIGKTDRARMALAKSPDALRGGYNEVIRDKTQTLQRYLDTIAAQTASREEKVNRLEAMQATHTKLTRGQQGALSLAKTRAEEIETSLGRTPTEAELQADAKYQQLRNAYTNKAHALENISGRIEEIERSIEEHSNNINDMTMKAMSMRTEITSLADEREDAVADVIQSQADRAAAAAAANLPTEDKTQERLRMLRDVRAQERAKAKVAKNIAATDAGAFEAALEREGTVDTAASEFDALVSGVELTEVVSSADALELGGADDQVEAPVDEAPAEVTVAEKE